MDGGEVVEVGAGVAAGGPSALGVDVLGVEAESLGAGAGRFGGIVEDEGDLGTTIESLDVVGSRAVGRGLEPDVGEEGVALGVVVEDEAGRLVGGAEAGAERPALSRRTVVRWRSR